jgi:hypothetical protein
MGHSILNNYPYALCELYGVGGLEAKGAVYNR